jgi:hypothetical protein
MSTIQIIFLIALVYGLPTFIALENVEFQPMPKYLFSLTVVPLFIVVLYINLVIIQQIAPSLIPDIMNLPDTPARRPKSLLELIISMPVPSLICWVWYQFIKSLNYRLCGQEKEKP